MARCVRVMPSSPASFLVLPSSTRTGRPGLNAVFDVSGHAPHVARRPIGASSELVRALEALVPVGSLATFISVNSTSPRPRPNALNAASFAAHLQPNTSISWSCWLNNKWGWAKGVPRGEVQNSGLSRARPEGEDGEFIRVQHLAQQARTPAPECSLHAGHMQQVASKPNHPHGLVWCKCRK